MTEICNNKLINGINAALFPLKQIIPQPIIKKIPYLTTNEDIRLAKALEWTEGFTLDIGCGANRFIREYRKTNGDGVGVDVYDWGGQDLLIRDSRNLPFKDASFDTVTFIACLNHIPERLDALVEARRVLKTEGQLIITNLTPLIGALWHKYAFWDKDQHDRGMEVGEAYGLPESELIRLFRKAKFRIVQKRSFSWRLNTIYRCRKISA